MKITTSVVILTATVRRERRVGQFCELLIYWTRCQLQVLVTVKQDNDTNWLLLFQFCIFTLSYLIGFMTVSAFLSSRKMIFWIHKRHVRFMTQFKQGQNILPVAWINRVKQSYQLGPLDLGIKQADCWFRFRELIMAACWWLACEVTSYHKCQLLYERVACCQKWYLGIQSGWIMWNTKGEPLIL